MRYSRIAVEPHRPHRKLLYDGISEGSWVHRLLLSVRSWRHVEQPLAQYPPSALELQEELAALPPLPARAIAKSRPLDLASRASILATSKLQTRPLGLDHPYRPRLGIALPSPFQLVLA